MMRALAVALGCHVVAASAANPIRKVVTLMQDMQKEIVAEGEKEEELYGKFKCYCSGNKEQLVAAADASAEEIERLSSKLKAEKAEKKQIEGELLQAKKDRADAKQDLAKATEIRKKEHGQYVKDAGETKQNIDSTNAAITSLSKGSGAGFLQASSGGAQLLKRVISSAPVDAEDRETILSFLSQSGDYVPQSGQIIGILKNMKDDMDKSLGGIVSEEETGAASFTDLKVAKSKEIEALNEAVESKTKRSGQLAVSIVQAQNAHDDTADELEAAKKFLVNLEVTCAEKAEEMESRTKTRNEEVAAISEAISVLNDDDALDIFKASLPTPSGAAFLQFAYLKPGEKAAEKKGNGVEKKEGLVSHPAGSAAAAKAEQVKKAVEQVKKVVASADKKAANPAVSLLVQSVLSKLHNKTSVDFSSVMKMIDDMVALLKKEQKDDATHQSWCNGEFDQSSDEKKDLNLKVEALVSSISELNDEITNLGKNIAGAQGRIQDLDKSVAEGTAQRKQEHAEYTSSVQLNQAAVQLIFKAKNRLQKFYNPGQYVDNSKRELTREEQLVQAGGGQVDDSAAPQLIAGTAQTVNFIQLRRTSAAPPPPPETFGAYKSKGQKSNSIMSLMDMLTKELETDIQQAEHDEKTANKEYAELVADAQESRSGESKSITGMEGNKANLENVLEETKREHIIKADQLQQTQTYIGELHQSCDFILNNFALREESRTKEIESLTNAKAVLGGANYQ